MSYGPFTPFMFASSAVAASSTGVTTEVTMFSKTLKAGMVGPNDYIDIWTRWSHTNSAPTKTYRVKIGTTAYLAAVLSTSASFQRRVLIMNRNSLASQVAFGVALLTDSGVTTTAASTFTEDLSVDKTFALTIQLGTAAPTAVLESFYAIIWKAAIN